MMGVVIITVVAFIILLLMLAPSLFPMSVAQQSTGSDESYFVRMTLRSMVYFKDERTGLCFAAIETDGGRDASLTCVPCEAVQDLLVKPFEPVREPEPEPRHPNNNYIHR
jgi:hypothetical protein